MAVQMPAGHGTPVTLFNSSDTEVGSAATPFVVSGPAATTLTATQVTVPATANGILILAANASRKGATVSNAGAVSVFIQQAATGVTVSNGFEIPGGGAYNIDFPNYTGAIYGIVATGTKVVTVVELT